MIRDYVNRIQSQKFFFTRRLIEPKYTVRLLELHDKDAIVALNESSDKLCGMPKLDDYDSYFPRVAERYLRDESRATRLYGAFTQEGSLSAMAGMKFWPDFPYWSLTNVKTSPQGTRLGIFNNGIPECVERVLKEAQAQGYYRHYYMFAVRNFTFSNPERHAPFQRAVPELQKYDIVTEALIPAQSLPKFDYHWFVMGKRTYPYDIVIRVATLKDKYRDRQCIVSKKVEQSRVHDL